MWWLCFLLYLLMLSAAVRGTDKGALDTIEYGRGITYSVVFPRERLPVGIPPSQYYPMKLSNGSSYICILPETPRLGQEQSSQLGRPPHEFELNSLLSPHSTAALHMAFHEWCYIQQDEWWTYEFCWNQHIVQFRVEIIMVRSDTNTPVISAHSEFHFVIGRMSPAMGAVELRHGVDPSGERYAYTMYSDGDVCDLTQVPRVTEVRLYCARDGGGEKLQVSESDVCRYVATVVSERACVPELWQWKVQRPSERHGMTGHMEARKSYSLHAPVTAVALGKHWFCLAIGNRVMAGHTPNPSPQTNTNTYTTGNSTFDGTCNGNTATNGSEEEMWLVAELPHGAVISSLEQHVTNMETSLHAVIVVVIGTGNHLFVAPLDMEGCVSSPLAHITLDGSARILKIVSVREPSTAGVLILTALNEVCFVSETSLLTADHSHNGITHNISNTNDNNSSSGTPFVRYTAEGLGVALAADAVMETHNEGRRMAVFSGTYAGSIAAWSIPLPSTRHQPEGEERNISVRSLPVYSWIHAHQPGCAVFAVKVLTTTVITTTTTSSNSTIEGSCTVDNRAHFCIATCSDDRTATLYVPSTPTCTLTRGMTWSCCWRGGGVSFSRRRIFDVAISYIHDNGGRLFLATGGEDGCVQAFGFHAQELLPSGVQDVCETNKSAEDHTFVKAVMLLRRDHQHSGRGVYRVLLHPTYHSAVAVISCGFDGSAHYTAVSTQSTQRAVVVPAELRRRRHVRCVVCDEVGALLACTEAELIIAAATNGDVSEVRVQLPATTASTSTTGTNSAILGKRGNLATCIGLVTRVPHERFVALVGTTAGHVYGISYTLVLEGQEEGEREEELSEITGELKNECFTHTASVLFVATPLSSKVLVVRGLYWREYLLFVSIHTNGTLVLSACTSTTGSTPVVWRTCTSPGVHTTTLSICLISSNNNNNNNNKNNGQEPEEYLCVLVGDDAGGVSVDVIQLTDHPHHLVSSVLHQESFFHHAVACVQHETPTTTRRGEIAPLSNSTMWFTAVSVLGECRVFLFHTFTHRVDVPPVSCPLRLPWRMSSVLSISETVAVTMFGTEMTVFTRRPLHYSWQPIAQYHGVKAPRLLSATISTTIPHTHTSSTTNYNNTINGAGVPVSVCHCSDGVQVEWHMCHTKRNTATRILHGGVITGQEYNTALFLPTPALHILCGCENSMITVISALANAELDASKKSESAPVTLCGPHESNILAMTLCGVGKNYVRFATVGSLATVVLWEWDVRYNWRVVAHFNQQEQQDEKENVTRTTTTIRKDEGKGDIRCVPRFLSVCATHVDIVVGSSDGTLKVFTLSDTLDWCYNVQLTPTAAKPVTAVSTLCASERLVIAGDTNGTMAVCHVSGGTIGAHRMCARAAVNAISVGRKRQQAIPIWRVLAAMDSGDVLLLHVSLSIVEVVCSVRVGLTAGRGVSWIPPHDEEKESPAEEDTAVAVNDERVAFLRVCQASHVGGLREGLCVDWHRRLNVRGVSGMTLATVGGERAPVPVCVVVGQGVEMISLHGEKSVCVN